MLCSIRWILKDCRNCQPGGVWIWEGIVVAYFRIFLPYFKAATLYSRFKLCTSQMWVICTTAELTYLVHSGTDRRKMLTKRGKLYTYSYNIQTMITDSPNLSVLIMHEVNQICGSFCDLSQGTYLEDPVIKLYLIIQKSSVSMYKFVPMACLKLRTCYHIYDNSADT